MGFTLMASVERERITRRGNRGGKPLLKCGQPHSFTNKSRGNMEKILRPKKILHFCRSDRDRRINLILTKKNFRSTTCNYCNKHHNLPRFSVAAEEHHSVPHLSAPFCRDGTCHQPTFPTQSEHDNPTEKQSSRPTGAAACE